MMINPTPDQTKLALLDAALPHVAFDGWSPETFRAAVEETDISMDHARTLCPRGAVDLAVLSHHEGDRKMAARMQDEDMSALRYSEKVARTIRLRLDVADDKEVVRRGTTLFALPHLAADGAKLLWGTADAIWNALGDDSTDVNWYTKRATLTGVYASVVLYWLGDNSFDGAPTHDFIDRRIADVMRIEKVKARVNASPLLKPMTGPLTHLLGMVKAPNRNARVDLPGKWQAPKTGQSK